MRSKIFALSFVLFLTGMSCAFAQGFLKVGFDTDEFPLVSFVWHESNPALLDASAFQSLTENGIPQEYSVTYLPQVIDEDEDRYVVFLWEDMAYHGYNLYEFSREVLSAFIRETDIGTNDKINVSVYGRREVNEDTYLRDLTGGFVSDTTTLLSSVERYVRSNKWYRNYPNRADIFPAVSEAVDKLRKEKDGVKSVIVITAGYPLDNSSASSDMNARLLAEKHHVPVYFLQYGRDHGYSDKLSSFAPLTYGTFQCFSDIDQKSNIANATAALSDIYASLSERYHGRDYKISFTSDSKRGDDARLISFNVNGFEYKEVMLPPARSFLAFVRNHPVLAVFMLLAILCLITLAIVFYVRSRKMDRIKLDNLKIQTRQDCESAMNAISDTRDSLGRRIEEIRSDKEAEEKMKLEELFRRKRVYPRIVCNVNGESFTYYVSGISTTIGRESSNDVVLNDNRVSRRHAKLEFTGYSFEIVDLGSMNGVVLNGEKINGAAPVKDADKLDLGGVILTVYF